MYNDEPQSHSNLEDGSDLGDFAKGPPSSGLFSHRGNPTAFVAVSTKQAAKMLGVSHRTMEDWRLNGQGPSFRKWGRLVRYLLPDLIAFAEGPAFANTGEALAN